MREVHLLEPGERGETYMGGRRPWQWREAVGYVFLATWVRVARMRQLKGQELRVLSGLVGHCDWNNRCLLSYAALGRAIGLTRAQVSRAIPHLIAAHLVYVETPDGHRGPVVTLSPYLVWRGRPWRVGVAREQFDAQWRLCHLPDGAEEDPSPSPLPRTRQASSPRGVTSRKCAVPFLDGVLMDEVGSQ